MATNTQIVPVQARFAGLPRAADRAKAFREAKRHSLLVKFLRLALPVAALSIAGTYFIPNKLSVKVDGGEASVDSIDVSSGGLKMVNPRIKGVHEKHGVYDIRADHATQHASNPELITLVKITGELVSKSGEKTILTAPSGIFHSKKEELIFDNGVDIGGDAGFSGKMKTATAYFQNNKLISQDPVEFGFHKSTIKARSVTLYSSESRVIFDGAVKVHLQRDGEVSPK
jgi:lipopolysaccharide export system protein LptC